MFKNIKPKFGSAFVIAVRISDSNCKCVNACFVFKPYCVLRLGTIDCNIFASVLRTAYASDFSLNVCTVLFSKCNNFFCGFDIFIKRQMRAVKHNRRKAKFKRLIDFFNRFAVVKVNCNRSVCTLCGAIF